VVAERSSQSDLRDLGVWELLNLVRQPDLVQQQHDRRIHAVASKVAVEVLLRLQERHRYTPAPEQQGQHQAAGAAAHDAATRSRDRLRSLHLMASVE
jgi:hypothetical protein